MKKLKGKKWPKDLMRVYQKYPAAFRSSYWPEIVKMVNSGDVDGAMELAKEHEGEHKAHRAHNVIARRIKNQRVALFKLQIENVAAIKSEVRNAAQALAHRMIHLPNTVSAIAPMRVATREVMVLLRRNLNKIITDLIWKSILLGVKNMGEAIKPILRDNQESFQVELKEVQLIEDRLSIGISRSLAGRASANVDLGSEKWQAILDKIYRDIVMKRLTGLTLSERIWDLTNRAEQDLKRLIASEIAKGTSSRDIADRIEKDVLTSGIDDVQSGPGIYKSPLKNALRVARTETNRAYAMATAAWAESKAWVKGIRVTLSASHDIEDDCDAVVNDQPDDGYSPDEFADVVPVHPHCMCFGTYVIDENYLTGDGQTADATGEDAEEAA